MKVALFHSWLMLAIAAVGWAAGAQEAKTEGITLHPVQETEGQYSCSCRFWLQGGRRPEATERPVFVSGWKLGDKLAWINIDGQARSLLLMRAEDPAAWEPEAASERLYESESIMVRAEFKQAGECRGTSVCDAIRVGGRLLVRSEHEVHAFQVTGRCGC